MNEQLSTNDTTEDLTLPWIFSDELHIYSSIIHPLKIPLLYLTGGLPTFRENYEKATFMLVKLIQLPLKQIKRKVGDFLTIRCDNLKLL